MIENLALGETPRTSTRLEPRGETIRGFKVFQKRQNMVSEEINFFYNFTDYAASESMAISHQ